jgi:hypothetical protein
MTNERIEIQIQDGGNWRTIHITFNNSQLILNEMKNLKQRYPDKRVRAIDANGRLVDLMG